MFRQRCTGFTLWEALAVFCVIAVAAAILFPVFQKVREPHPRGCQSNLKQLGLALIQYSQDADETFPQGATPLNTGWAGQIYPYLKATGVYLCPVDSAEAKHISYAENQRIAGQTLRGFSDAAYTVSLYEATTRDCDPSTAEQVSATGLTAPQDSLRHDRATFALNYLANDGHVRWLKPAQISSGLHPVSIHQAKAGPFMMTFSLK